MLDAQLAYWKQQLARAPAVIDLPLDHPRPPVMSRRQGRHAFALPPALSHRLEALARAQGMTVDVLLLAAFQALLHRTARQDDILVGLQVVGRARPERAPLIGSFANTLVLRAELSHDPTFLELLAQVRERVRGAYAHQDVPFEHVVEALVPEHGLGHAPLVQVGFRLERAPALPLERPGVTATPIAGASPRPPLDLDLQVVQHDDHLAGVFEFARDLFEDATIARMAGRLECLLEGIVAAPERRVSRLPVLPDAERRRVLVEWNRTGPRHPDVELVLASFARPLARTPDAIAVRSGRDQLTYRELDERANQLAHHLRAHGIGADALVGVCLERSLEVVVALLGVWKAGAGYVPIDPTYPRERIAYMLRDARMGVLLTQERLVDRLPAHDVPLVRLDRAWPDVARHAVRAPDVAIDPENLAYVIYTSGSTGRPKGVMVSHRGLASYLAWCLRAYPAQGRGAPVHSSLAFDLTVTSIWPPLLAGATVTLLPERADAMALGELLQRERDFSIVKLTPSHLEVLNQQIRPERAAGLTRAFVIGGEALAPASLELWRQHAPATRLINEYGPTETVVGCCAYDVPADTTLGASVPIGTPIDHMAMYVLDGNLEPVPIGAVGELYVGGVAMARGYLGRPELTAERFLPDPFVAIPGARMYRTGDLGRHLADGNLAYLGRIDHQVKLRGFRIELGEIEAALARRDDVQEVVVIAREDRPGDQRLVAYLVGQAASRPAARELAAALASSLPDYMVPSAFVWLDAMPLTPNGKLDRKALPAPDPERTPRAPERAPATAEARALAAIWEQLLGIARVGLDDRFLELGGHSLLATRLVSRVRDELGVDLPLRAVFEAPTLEALAERLAAARAAQPATAAPIEPVPRTGELPASFAQLRLWLIDQITPGSALYNLPVVFELSGALDVAALERALQDLHERHETLRSTFVARGGRPVVVPSQAPLSLARADVPAGEVRARVEAEILRPFDLRHDLPWRALLMRAGDASHVLVLTLHHIVADGWSLDVLTSELAQAYAARHAGRGPAASAPAVQYGDYAVWQQRQLALVATQLAYWKQQLAGSPPVIELPLDRPRPAAPTHRGGRHVFALSPELSRELAALSQRHGATLYMTLLAAFQTLLHRTSRQDDILVGSPVAGRTRRELEHLIGFFVNTLVLRADFSRDPTFAELLAQVRDTALAAYAHQDVPFEQVVDALAPERSLGYTPLFQVVFQLDRPYAATLELPGVTATPRFGGSPLAKFDLHMEVIDGAAQLEVRLHFARDLFDDASIERMAGRFARLLEGIVRDPDRRVGQIELLSPDERDQVVAAWNATDLAFAPDQRAIQLFEAQVERAPDALAIRGEARQLTYRELDERANHVAHVLQRRGVGPDVLVGVCCERSVELAIAVLAVHKAGGAYVPLDPGYPRDRLAYMLQDAGARVLLTQQRVAAQLPDHAADAICVDAGAERAARRPRCAASAEHLAYVIYTSGSTGRPKGVAVPHRGLAHLIAWHRARYAVGPADRATLFASPGFDASGWELWPYLAAGASLVVVPDAVRASAEALRDFLVAERVTRAFVPTPVAEPLVAIAWPRDAALRQLLTGGDRLVRRPPSDLPFALVNHYGPTEYSVVTTAGRVEPDGASAPAIGRPIANTRVYILDAALQPAGIGVPGELHVHGEGLARGYLGRPDLTAERFVPDPFGSGGRLYRTGDLARWSPSGEIEFLGRNDHQVKIRGVRIELGEIEAALARRDDLAEAAVIARDDGGDRRLVAYVVPRGAARSTTPELRRFLATSLPDHMIPPAFVWLEAMPLTPNGKLDRKALPRPEPSDDGAAYSAPRTPHEELLAGIWSQLLGVARVGIDDNFFHLGGHSLLATRMVSRVREVLGGELPVRAVFEAPTLAALARRIGDARSPGAAIARLPAGSELPLSFAQQRLWLIDRLEGGSAHYNIPLVLRLSGALDVPALERSLQDLHARHQPLRDTFVERGGGPIVVLSGAPFALRQRELPAGEDVREHVRAEITRPFDLASELPWRALLLRVAPGEDVLVLTLHHIVCDGWSTNILADELRRAYEAHHAGRTPSFAPLPVQYADYAAWQRDHLRGELLARQLAYWKQQLAGAPPVLELPLDHPRPRAMSQRGGQHVFEIGAPRLRALQALSRAHDTTLYMTMLAAFQTLLHRYTRQDDILVGSPIAGRTRHELEGLIGFFVNTLVMRADFTGNPPFRELLRQVRETAVAAYAHQDVPFDKLVEELAPERSLSYAPVFQAFFQLEKPYATGLRLPEVAVAPEVPPSTFAKFDLLVEVHEELDRLIVKFGFARDLFEDATIARMAGHFERLLEAIVADPHARVGDLPLLPERERARLLVAWNTTHADYPRDRCLHHLFEHQAARTPEAVAVQHGAASLTYRELDRRANQLAQHLCQLGVRPESRVGICLERSLEMIVGMLGVLKAGGAYVPLDPAYPAERLQYMLKDAGARVLVTRGARAPIEVPRELRVVRIDRDVPPSTSDAPVASGVGPDHLAYVIYTSGSTGRPKGVAIAHRSPADYVQWARGYIGPTTTRGSLGSTSISFDVSVFELFTTLASGGTIVLVDHALALAGHPAFRQVTWLNTVPSAMSQLLELDAVPPSLETVDLAGEAVTRALVDRLYAVPTIRRVVNLYGPTETGYTTFARLSRGERVHIGRPLPGVRIYLLDHALQPVPIGVAGELYASGVGVARGYVDQPGMTAQRFVPDPFGGDPGARMYRTGDLARYLPDGDIEYLGRADAQVKLRGFRIELGEIEARLRAQPGVREAAVIVREDTPGDKRLVAYLVAATGAPPGHDDLRRFVGEALPDYMVPSAFVWLETLPQTPNGKIDHKALPAPEIGRDAARHVAPRTPTEVALAEIWAEVLGLPRVGLADNFFHLGGHSLLAARLVARVRERLGVELALRGVFAQPTMALQAQLVDEARDGARAGEEAAHERQLIEQVAALSEAALGEHLEEWAAVQLPEVDLAADHGLAGPRRDLLAKWIAQHRIDLHPSAPLARRTQPSARTSRAQQLYWAFHQRDNFRTLTIHARAYALHGPLDVRALHQAIATLVDRQGSLRTVYARHGERVTQTVLPCGPALEVIDLTALPAGAREREAHRQFAHAARPHDLAREVFRARLLRLPRDRHLLFLVPNHIAIDGFSWGVLEAELAACYRALAAGGPPVLAPLALQHGDFAFWQSTLEDRPVGREQLAYWARAVAGYEGVELPGDVATPARGAVGTALDTYAAGEVPFAIDGTAWQEVERLCARLGCTPYAVIATGFLLLLTRWSGRDDACVLSSNAHRSRPGSEAATGIFATPYPLRVSFDERATLEAAVRRCLDSILAQREHWHVAPASAMGSFVEWSRYNLNYLIDGDHAAFDLGTVRSEPLPWSAHEPRTSHDLALFLLQDKRAVRGKLLYNAERFSPELAARIAARIRQHVAAIATSPSSGIRELPRAP